MRFSGKLFTALLHCVFSIRFKHYFFTYNKLFINHSPAIYPSKFQKQKRVFRIEIRKLRYKRTHLAFIAQKSSILIYNVRIDWDNPHQAYTYILRAFHFPRISRAENLSYVITFHWIQYIIVLFHRKHDTF